MSGPRTVRCTVNGHVVEGSIDARTSLADFLRDQAALKGTRLGCEHGVCGACTVLVEDRPVRACLVLAMQADDLPVITIEGLEPAPGQLSATQLAFREAHAVQCGFCTSGMLIAVESLLAEHPEPDEAMIRDHLHGNLCRCTGYQQIVEAVQLAARMRREGGWP